MRPIADPKTLATFPTWFPAEWQGAFWKVVSCACFAVINGIVRYWSGGTGEAGIEVLPVNVMMFFQNVFGALLLLPWLMKFKLREFKIRYPVMHLIRVVTAVGGIYLWYLSLKYMPIAEGVALSFTGPILTVIGARFFLGEKISFQRLIAIALSISGAIMISRPIFSLENSQLFGFVALLPICSALFIAFNKLLTRQLAMLGETPTALASYLLILMIPVSLFPAVFDWITPSAHHWPWLILLGLLAASAHLSFGKAYQLAEVTFLTPFGFTKFFLSTLVGFFAFSEIPSSWSLWIGTFIIFTSILLLGYKIPLYSIAKRFRSS